MGEICKTIFELSSGSGNRICDSSVFSADGILISASVGIPPRDGVLGGGGERKWILLDFTNGNVERKGRNRTHT